jgi:diguanylate cyclase (GGDEF)-like protein
MIGLLVFASGGADSPYIFLYAQMMLYIAYFVDSSRLRVADLAFASLVALAPIAYDNSVALHNDFVPKIAVALAVWWPMCALASSKHRASLRAERRARRLSLTDPLTGTANLRAINEFIADLKGKPFALAMADLKGLGAINARYGYYVGDDLVRRAAESLREASGPHDQVARVGGDEFVVVIPGGAELAAELWSHRLAERVAIENNCSEGRARIAASVGGAAAPRDGESLAELIAVADRQVAEQKREGAHQMEPRSVAPQARAERLFARGVPDERPSSRWSIERLRPPCGPIAALFAASATALIVYLTGGGESVLLPLVAATAAYFAYFGNTRQALFGVGATLTAVAVAVFAGESTGTTGQSRLSTIIFSVVVITFTLQTSDRKLAAAENNAEEESLTDSLTGLSNRRAFDREFGDAVDLAGRRAGATAEAAGNPGIVLVDLENFKDVNASLGHHGGNVLLCEVTDALRGAVGEDGVVYRIGGDQFAVVCEAHHVQRVETIATRCVASIRELDHDGRYLAQMVAIGAVVGFALWKPGATTTDLISHSVKRMADPDLPLRVEGVAPSVAS